jgi:amino acid transporter
MLVFGLVHDGGWEPPEHGPGPEPPEDQPPERRPWSWRLPWRPLAWFAAWSWLMALVPVVSSAAGGLAGFGVLMLAFGLVCWRLERFCTRAYWHGLREYKY